MAKRRLKDPYAERESAKYENPIPSRELILELLGQQEGPVHLQELASLLGLSADDELEAIRRRVGAMLRDGQLVRDRRDCLGVAEKMDVVAGRVIAHPDGFGFLVPDAGGDDLFLSAKQMRSLLHGDRIMAHVIGVDRRGRLEGAVVEVLERANNRVVGRFCLEHGVGIVIPDNKRITQDILIPAEWRGGALDGQIVVAQIVDQPTHRSQPIGKLVEVLGDHMAPGMEIDVAIRAHELPLEWPAPVQTQIAGIHSEVAEADKEGRVDLRNTPLVTIDGEDARDFDDAVYCERRGKGWRLLVAIADVSHYVAADSPLDREAHNRGNSVYFPGRVIPMLPEALSNGLCSLNPQVDRLCMVCEMYVSSTGAVQRFRFFPAVMRSHARLTYTEVAAMVQDRDKETRRAHRDLVPHLDNLHALFNVFSARRDSRGAIDFETTETRIMFGREKKIERIVPVVRNDAHRMIEEYMIAANVCAAEFLLANQMPALYRVHSGPSDEKLTNLRSFLSELGLSLGGGDDPQPKHYSKLLGQVRERPDAHLIQTVLLRSMSQAVYSPDNLGHFGLAYEAYTHFTSPIRRYPDLLTHRAIRNLLNGRSVKRYRYSPSDMLVFGEHCSMTERRADEATRDALDWLKCEYMMERVGDEYDGLITGVTSFGIFVELDDIYVEGLVHITSLNKDYYHFDPVKHRLVGERTKMTYRLADKVRVKVARVDLDRKQVDFDLADDRRQPEAPPARPTKAKSGRRRSKSRRKAARSKTATSNTAAKHSRR